MHNHKTHCDREATRAARKAGRFVGRHSYISTRIHPGTDHQCMYLAGEADCWNCRENVFVRAGGRCEMCGAWYGLNYGEMDHIEHMTKVSRCWCDENLRWLCRHCHRSRHVRILWSKREDLQPETHPA